METTKKGFTLTLKRVETLYTPQNYTVVGVVEFFIPRVGWLLCQAPGEPKRFEQLAEDLAAIHGRGATVVKLVIMSKMQPGKFIEADYRLHELNAFVDPEQQQPEQEQAAPEQQQPEQEQAAPEQQQPEQEQAAPEKVDPELTRFETSNRGRVCKFYNLTDRNKALMLEFKLTHENKSHVIYYSRPGRCIEVQTDTALDLYHLIYFMYYNDDPATFAPCFIALLTDLQKAIK